MDVIAGRASRPMEATRRNLPPFIPPPVEGLAEGRSGSHPRLDRPSISPKGNKDMRTRWSVKQNLSTQINPTWFEDGDPDYLELIYDNLNWSLFQSTCGDHKSQGNLKRLPKPKACPGCSTVFTHIKSGDEDECPFCHHKLSFKIKLS